MYDNNGGDRNPYMDSDGHYGGTPFRENSGRTDGDNAGKRVGRAVLSGVVAGLVGGGIICLVGSAVFLKAIDHSVEAAAEKIEQSIGDSWGSQPDFGQNGSGSSGEAPDEQDVDSGSASASSAFLGVVCGSISDIQDADTSDYPDGVYVKEVADGSPASLGNIKAGDMITAVDDTEVTSFEELASAIAEHQSGDSVTITLQRKNGSEWKESTHQVTLAEKPQQASGADSGTDMFGQMFGN